MNIPDELVIEGVARAFTRAIEAQPDLAERVVSRIAELRAEIMTPTDASAMLGISATTLLRNHKEYGLDKSTALGSTEPRFFRTQIIALAKDPAKVVRGRKPVLPFPSQVNSKVKPQPTGAAA